MPTRTVIAATVAVLAIVVGAALSFFELIILGIVAAIAAAALALSDRRRATARG